MCIKYTSGLQITNDKIIYIKLHQMEKAVTFLLFRLIQIVVLFSNNAWKCNFHGGVLLFHVLLAICWHIFLKQCVFLNLNHYQTC